ncbi:hypothetical protein PG990_002894 [Apiospora arundinis]
MPRTSHAVLNRRKVSWEGQELLGPSMVYNCRSDVICQTPEENDILMSVTSFPDIPRTIGVMYGCTDDVMDYVMKYLRTFKRSAFHPLMFPMMFVEIERKRLIEALRDEMSNLNQRLLNMAGRLGPRKPKGLIGKAGATGEKKSPADDNDNMLQKDGKAASLWFKVSELKNGVQSLIVILESVATHCEDFLPETGSEKGNTAGNRRMYTDNTEKFQTRVEEMLIELKSEVQKCDGVLGGMSLATQMEWNYHSRRDAKVNIIIAYASKRDSSQMRYISFLGMVFLPGTFLAIPVQLYIATFVLTRESKTLFSMTFFNWHPDGSPGVISPWIGLYCGLAAMLTLLTYLRWKKYITEQDKIAGEDIENALTSDSLDSFH